MFKASIVIGLGASFGALLRWQLGLWLNALLPHLPLGTLLANLIGGYLMGLALGLFATHPGLAPEWRLLIMTGFLGGLTTFSTFSGETVVLIQQGRLLWAGALIALHVLGTLAMTLLGLATLGMLKGH